MELVGCHFSANCARRRCWQCGEPGHVRNYCLNREPRYRAPPQTGVKKSLWDGLVIFRPAAPLASAGGVENPDLKRSVAPERKRVRMTEFHCHLPWPGMAGKEKKESTGGFSTYRGGRTHLYGESTGKFSKGVCMKD